MNETNSIRIVLAIAILVTLGMLVRVTWIWLEQGQPPHNELFVFSVVVFGMAAAVFVTRMIWKLRG